LTEGGLGKWDVVRNRSRNFRTTSEIRARIQELEVKAGMRIQEPGRWESESGGTELRRGLMGVGDQSLTGSLWVLFYGGEGINSAISQRSFLLSFIRFPSQSYIRVDASFPSRYTLSVQLHIIGSDHYFAFLRIGSGDVMVKNFSCRTLPKAVSGNTSKCCVNC